VILRRIITKKLRVQAVTRGQPSQGYEISGEPLVEPTEVSVRGPKEVLEVVSVIQTEPVDIEGRSSSFSSDYSLSSVLNGKRVETQTKVRVRINIKPIEIVRMVKVPVHISIPPGYEHEVQLPKSEAGGVVEIPLKGPEFLLNEAVTIKKISVFVVVSPDMVPRPGIPYSVKVNLYTPPELNELKLAGEHHVDLEIREKKTINQQPEDNPK
jgi:hypothetical protein